MDIIFIYNKFINKLIKKGKKQKAEKIAIMFFILLAKKKNANSFTFFFETIKKITPALTLKTIKKSGQSVSLPLPINTKKQFCIALSWFIAEARKHAKKNIAESIVIELLRIEKGESVLVRKKEILYKNADNNRNYFFIIK